MNIVTLLNIAVAAASGSLWLFLFFGLFQHASVLMRLAFVCIPTGQTVTIMMAVAGMTQPNGADLLTGIGVLCGTIWLVRRKAEVLQPFTKLDRWV